MIYPNIGNATAAPAMKIGLIDGFRRA